MMSVSVMSGKSGPYGLPVFGFVLAGAVEPYEEPSMFDDTTKYRSVSMDLPEPTRPLHQPANGMSGVGALAAKWLPVKRGGTRSGLRPYGAASPDGVYDKRGS